MRLLPHRIWFRKKAVNRGRRGLGIEVLILLAVMALLIPRAVLPFTPFLWSRPRREKVPRVPRGQVERQVRPFRHCDGLFELP